MFFVQRDSNVDDGAAIFKESSDSVLVGIVTDVSDLDADCAGVVCGLNAGSQRNLNEYLSAHKLLLVELQKFVNFFLGFNFDES